MKQCIKCQTELNDDVQYCPNCGTKWQESENQFCRKCGEKLDTFAKFCPKCGTIVLSETTATGLGTQSNVNPSAPKSVITLSKREKLCSIFWIVVASFQAMAAIYYLNLIAKVYNPEDAITGAVFFGALSAINLYTGIKGINFSNKILSYSCGPIMTRYKSIVQYIITIAYNGVLFIVCITDEDSLAFVILAAVGFAIFDLVGVRNFAMNNSTEISAYEEAFSGIIQINSGKAL